MSEDHIGGRFDDFLAGVAWLGPEQGGRVELWLGQQAVYGQWQMRQKSHP